jgi:hypothetical protein
VASASPEPDHRAIAVLRELGILYALVGGVAANQYRRSFRFTHDFDYLVASFDGLREELKSAGFQIAIGETRGDDSWHIKATVDGVSFDFVLAEVDVQIDAVRNAQFNQKVATIEDLIVLKLLAHRPQDNEDLRNIASSGRKVDMTYIQQRAHRLDEHFGTKAPFVKFEQHYREVQQRLRGPGSGGLGVG